ncbi:MAG: sodium:proton exchanger [Chloroflexi bacterium]|nr:MAG: sodium:proton exchanger [Chloroflexota bacterium]TMG22552.1 MAG: sodium:proton exchanger [Chloroflexota bacterium]TMG68108.1 MAG: sodium:proton exchanger [Chloroflexota bacterium]
MNVPTDLLSSIGICVGAAALIAAVTWRFKQPLIIAYLLTGVIIGPRIGLRFITNEDSIQTVAEIGLILLLFVIGLEIDLRKMASGGAAVLLTGALQVPICIALGLAFFAVLGVTNSEHSYALLYLAACMSLSSTLVVVKILNDKFELDTLPGRITLGVLVIQDLWAVGMLAVQPNILNPNLVPLLGSLWRGAVLVVGGFALSKYALPYLFRMVAKAPELVLVSALGWCFFLAGAASLIGLSREMGALIAGVSLSTFPYNVDVVAKAVSLRDFFVTLFFVALGMQITIPSPEVLGLALAASAFVIVSRVVVVPILYALRLGLRTSIVPAINLAQVSEFSIVIASLGVTLHQINQDVLTVVIVTFAVTSVVSTYMINFSHAIQRLLAAGFRAVGLKDLDAAKAASQDGTEPLHQPVIFLGFFRDTSSILYEFEHEGSAEESKRFLEKILVIDFNPTVLRELRRKNITCVYGDIAHADTLRHAGVEHAQLVVSSITDDVLRGTSNLRLMNSVHTHAPNARVVLTTDHIPQALRFYEEGADFVFIPRLYSAAACARILRKGLAGGFEEVRSQAIEHLSKRQEVLA